MMVQRVRVVVQGVKVGGNVIYEGSSILGINVKKGFFYLVWLLSLCRE